MKVIKIIGGLGNQMFQYSLFLSLCRRFPDEDIFTDTSYFSTYHLHNGLELERVFNIGLNQAPFGKLLKVTYPVKWYKLSRAIRKFLPKRKTELVDTTEFVYNPEVFTPHSKYYDGYWQAYIYFDDYRDLILEKFRFSMPINSESRKLIAELDANGNSVSIHIRRGDYLKDSIFAGVCGIEYYEKALDYIFSKISNPVFYVFSDDIDWCRDNITPLLNGCECRFVDWNRGTDSPLDMLLMSKCSNNIIANSSFSWWGAYLNRHSEKIVCAPVKWTKTMSECHIQLPDWKLF